MVADTLEVLMESTVAWKDGMAFDVELDGPTTNNTHNYWPAGAPSTTDSYILRARPFLTYASALVTRKPLEMGRLADKL